MTPAQYKIETRNSLTEPELAAIEELAVHCRQHEGLELNLHIEFLRKSQTEEPNVFLCEEDGKLIGFLGNYGHVDTEMELIGMVHPDFRRRGVATALLQQVREEGKRRDVSRFVLICEPPSESGRAFLAAAGATYAFSEYSMNLEEVKQPIIVSPELLVQRAVEEDLPAYATVMALSFEGEEHPHAAMYQGLLGKWLQEPKRRLYVIRLAEEIIGGICCFFGGEKSASFNAFRVHPKLQGRGYGRQVLTTTIQLMLAEDRTHMELDVETENKNALGLYQSCGFREATSYDYCKVSF